MGDIRLLRYPKKSHRKRVVLPQQSARLAEFIGIMLGDGGINNLWQANITVNSVKDAEYAHYVSKLCRDLFNIAPTMRKRKNRQALVISLTSTSIVDFLVKQGLPRGNKLKHGLRIPSWILNKPAYRKACVRGLVDTDGCLFVHTHKIREKVYRNIGFSFTSYSPELIFQVANIVEEFAIMPHITKRGQNIYLYQAGAVIKYLKIFGTSNERINSVYRKWRDARVV
ncbi:MAG: LAGLIDADG family homing endonuclease [bacterium]|nr:LAGLIDADG family homing endonuclease [bacterium]